MEPQLREGDLVVAMRAERYAPGELVVMRVAEPGRVGLVIHRLVALGPDGWTTRGDNNPRPDPWLVRTEQILGRFVISVPGLGNGLLWLRANPLVFGGVCGILTLLLYVPWPRAPIEGAQRVEISDATRDQRAESRSAAVGRGSQSMRRGQFEVAADTALVEGAADTALVEGAADTALVEGAAVGRESKPLRQHLESLALTASLVAALACAVAVFVGAVRGWPAVSYFPLAGLVASGFCALWLLRSA